MSNSTTNAVLNAASDEIDIPESSYKLAEARYKSISDWFDRDESKCAKFKPHLYPQGSFRLGTVIRPIDVDGEYDLDMGCRLRGGISKKTHTQKLLKELVGDDVEAYRVAQGFNKKREEKNRCWRLIYSDKLSFHLDVVPSIPEHDTRRSMIKEAMIKTGSTRDLAEIVANHAGAITDRTLPQYGSISDDWLISNSEGYAKWFESRMEQSRLLLEKWAAAARIDPLPTNRRKSPLQRCVQILKRHRDVMFKDNPDEKPISIIITTLAASAYQGEIALDDALEGILNRMEGLVRPQTPRVPNPVNPDEDFADKWPKNLQLEANFRLWIAQAKNDLVQIEKANTRSFADKILRQSLQVVLGQEKLAALPGLTDEAYAPKTHSVAAQPPKPWSTN